METMTTTVEQVTEENNRLYSELRKSFEIQMEAASQPLSNSNAGLGVVVDSLQQQLEITSRERDNFRSKLEKILQDFQYIQNNELVCSI